VTKPIYGALEGGGTKVICAVGYAADRVLERVTIPTSDPATTLGAAAGFFAAAQQAYQEIAALGVAFFGPLELRRERAAFGRLLDTPKPGWSGADLLSPLALVVHAPIAVDTDVGAAALAEWRLGAGSDVASLAYVTVGTGIGVGFAPDLLKAGRLLHPEAGHLTVRRAPGDDFAGICPFHGDCLEGLASGSAIRARWGCELHALPADHPAWEILGAYLGQLAASIALLVSVERIIFGGGVMAGGALLPHIRAAARGCLKRYIAPLNDTVALHRYICSPALGESAGITGAFLLAAAAGTRCETGCEEPDRAPTR
jgi:fructokinase